MSHQNQSSVGYISFYIYLDIQKRHELLAVMIRIMYTRPSKSQNMIATNTKNNFMEYATGHVFYFNHEVVWNAEVTLSTTQP